MTAETDRGGDERGTPKLVVHHPDTRIPERSYVLDVVLGEFLGMDVEARAEDRDDVRIARPDRPGEVRVADVLLDVDEGAWLTPKALPAEPVPRWDVGGTPFEDAVLGTRLPVLHGEPGFRSEDDRLDLGADLLGGVFTMLTRLEEVVHDDRDDHGRFPARASLAHREGFLDRPLADEYAEVLGTALARVWPDIRRSDRRGRVRPTHDVDHPWDLADRPAAEGLRRVVRDLLDRRDPLLSARRLASLLQVKAGRRSADLYDTFDALMDLSEARGTRSTFYLRVDHTGPSGRPPPDPSDPAVRELLGRIERRGHGIGVHPSYAALEEPARVRTEADRLREVLAEEGIDAGRIGGRMHYLRFRPPASWRAFEAAGLTHDSSALFADHAGFRCGTAREHPVFDVEERRRLDLRERPPVAMDATLLHPRYMGLTHETAAHLARKLKARALRYGGDWTVIWHNDRLVHRRDRRLYRELLAGPDRPPGDGEGP